MLRDPDDYHVYLVPLPAKIRGCVSYDEDGYPSVFLNSRLSWDGQRRALRHELKHIAGDDVFSDRPIRDVEGFAS